MKKFSKGEMDIQTKKTELNYFCSKKILFCCVPSTFVFVQKLLTITEITTKTFKSRYILKLAILQETEMKNTWKIKGKLFSKWCPSPYAHKNKLAQ